MSFNHVLSLELPLQLVTALEVELEAQAEVAAMHECGADIALKIIP